MQNRLSGQTNNSMLQYRLGFFISHDLFVQSRIITVFRLTMLSMYNNARQFYKKIHFTDLFLTSIIYIKVKVVSYILWYFENLTLGQNGSTSPNVPRIGTYMYLLVYTEYIYVPSRIRQGTYMYPVVYDRVHICTQSYTTEYVYVLSRIRLSTHVYSDVLD